MIEKCSPARNLEDISTILHLTDEELAWKENSFGLPVLISPYYLSLIDPDDPNDPIRRQVVPNCQEQFSMDSESQDPLSEEKHMSVNRLIHRYPSRAAFLVTDVCATYCRHCFRRRFSGGTEGSASREDIMAAATYIAMHKQIKEVLLTGGDPLTLSDSRLDDLLSIFREQRPDIILRICSRIPVTFPQRITDDLIKMIKKHDSAPFYLFTQFNHPREITEQSKRAIARFVDAGIPAMNQTVLLKGVNDSADILVELVEALVAIRVKPYYLFQGDLVGGTSHLRVDLEKGMALEQEMRQRVSGLAMPVYAIDLPDGGGKVPLGACYLEGRDASGYWVFKTVEGLKRVYPDPTKK
ncbi:MAG: KamA family radical SAM protein [Sphaerochaetaceae bacterium]|jgi:lysine 2,3-aminomutase|nr:KamA family radical SAM protein [Sphaerochaetaceae bacterium]NLO59693.1 KamA family radical SAM protein [Spirochaetales bacterium]MDD3670763.1 KamA family radical SAM protein [Sphaerochaetaceae bacterium]MDD4258341.1 KamA family radical SAM protein [Sphaerochaetaceae bacterium]MDD4763054.1 KamA family radical SAM protein [Sphaerochaetaceae bacterium]